jgi:hypothetical protein
MICSSRADNLSTMLACDDRISFFLSIIKVETIEYVSRESTYIIKISN